MSPKPAEQSAGFSISINSGWGCTCALAVISKKENLADVVIMGLCSRSRLVLCRFSAAGMTAYPRGKAAGGRKAPRQEIA
jgi:hypothetical protein